MTKAKLIAGFYRSTSPKHWLRLSWYLFAWSAWHTLGVKLSGEQTLIFRPFRVVVDPRGRGGLFFLHEILVRNIYALDQLPGAGVVFDVGANCGFFALMQTAKHPKLNVYCFEPHPETFQRLQKNIAVNKLTRVVAIHTAVGAMSGSCQINVSAESSMAIVNSSSVQFLIAPKTVEVPLTSLDDFAAARNVWPHFLKIDVEGFEAEVLRGAQRCLERSHAVVLEYHSAELQIECIGLLSAAGFTTRLMDERLLAGTKITAQ